MPMVATPPRNRRVDPCAWCKAALRALKLFLNARGTYLGTDGPRPQSGKPHMNKSTKPMSFIEALTTPTHQILQQMNAPAAQPVSHRAGDLHEQCGDKTD